MANPILPIPKYPDVPEAPGVPVVLRDPANSQLDNAPVLSADGPGVVDNSTAPQWGLFDLSGNLAIGADSVLGFEFRKEWRIPTYPQEQGAFGSYNKVELPGEPRMRLTKGGSIDERTAFLAQVMAACGSLDLYAAYTPEVQYDSVNPIAYDVMERTSDHGATLIVVDVHLQEVRLTGTQQFTSSATNANPTQTRQPSGQAQRNAGAVQAQTPTSAQGAAIQTGIDQEILRAA